MTIAKQALREEVSRGIRLRVRGVISGKVVGPPVTIDLAAVGAILPQSNSPISSYVHKPGDADFVRIKTYVADDARLTLNADTAGVLANDDVVDVYSVLTPDDWNGAIDAGLVREGRRMQTTVTLTSGQPEYGLTALAAALVSKEQVEEVTLRHTDGTNVLYEEPYPAYILRENDGVVTLQLHTVPGVLTNMTVEVYWKQFYTALATDAATTTCPDELAKAAVRVQALNVAWTIMGEEAAKDMFASELGKAIADLGDIRMQLRPRVKAVPIRHATPYSGPDLAVMPGGWRW